MGLSVISSACLLTRAAVNDHSEHSLRLILKFESLTAALSAVYMLFVR